MNNFHSNNHLFSLPKRYIKGMMDKAWIDLVRANKLRPWAFVCGILGIMFLILGNYFKAGMFFIIYFLLKLQIIWDSGAKSPLAPKLPCEGTIGTTPKFNILIK